MKQFQPQYFPPIFGRISVLLISIFCLKIKKKTMVLFLVETGYPLRVSIKKLSTEPFHDQQPYEGSIDLDRRVLLRCVSFC
jgi:hypothetical protein